MIAFCEGQCLSRVKIHLIVLEFLPGLLSSSSYCIVAVLSMPLYRCHMLFGRGVSKHSHLPPP